MPGSFFLSFFLSFFPSVYRLCLGAITADNGLNITAGDTEVDTLVANGLITGEDGLEILNGLTQVINDCKRYVEGGAPTAYPPTYLFTYLPIYLSTYLPTYPRTYLRTYVPTYLPTYLPYLPSFSASIHTYYMTHMSFFIHLCTYLQEKSLVRTVCTFSMAQVLSSS